MTFINSPVNTQYQTKCLEIVFKWIQKIRNYDGSEFHSWIQLVYLERAFAFDKRHSIKEFLQAF